MLDKNAIREAADIVVVAEEIGIPIRMMGNRPQIICPCHDDQHFGSCYLDTEKKTFCCYSCGAKGDIFTLVQSALHISFPKAAAVIAEICGGAELFKMSANDIELSRQYTKMMLPKSDIEFLGIHNDIVYADVAFFTDISDSDDEMGNNVIPEYDNDDNFIGYRVQKLISSNPLYDLMIEDEDAYKSLIDSFCENKIKDFQRLINIFQNIPAKQSKFGKPIHSIFKYVTSDDVISVIISMIKKVQKISEKYGNGTAISVADSPYTSKFSMLANNIWLQDKEAPF